MQGFLCIKIIVEKPKKWKPGGLIPRSAEIWQHLLRKAMAKNGLMCR
jgi:hypothetical protein